MRTKNEVLQDDKVPKNEYEVQMLFLETLLDIRDLLAENEDEKKLRIAKAKHTHHE